MIDMDLQDLKPGDVFLDGNGTLMIAIHSELGKIRACYLTNHTSSKTFSHSMNIMLCVQPVFPTKVICNLMKPFFELQLALHEQGILSSTRK